MANSSILLNQCEDEVETYETVDVKVTRLVSIWINYNDFVCKGSRPNFESNQPKITRVRNGISQSHKVTDDQPKSPKETKSAGDFAGEESCELHAVADQLWDAWHRSI